MQPALNKLPSGANPQIKKTTVYHSPEWMALVESGYVTAYCEYLAGVQVAYMVKEERDGKA